MNRLSVFRNRMMMVACCLFTLVGCSDDTAEDNRLPDGTSPMSLTAAVDGLAQTRAADSGTANGTWSGSEQIAVKVNSEVKIYIPSGSGSSVDLTSSAPFFWQASDETKAVSAWYCGDGSTAAGGKNADAVPTSWMVQSDQSATTSDGHQSSDFLYAVEKNISFSGSDKSLAFTHQTACVVINIVNAEAATEAGAITQVSIGAANNLALSGTYTAPAQGSGDTGTWDTSNSSSKGIITPKDITSAGGTYLKTYVALVIPQNMSGHKFIAVTLTDGNTYYYIPQNSDANLESGKQYTYNITVKYGYLDVKTVATDGEWGGGTTEDVTTKDVTTAVNSPIK